MIVHFSCFCCILYRPIKRNTIRMNYSAYGRLAWPEIVNSRQTEGPSGDNGLSQNEEAFIALIDNSIGCERFENALVIGGLVVFVLQREFILGENCRERLIN
ncbi:hypothetical protein VNO77_00433 [Canavalia gladiata]|uniref:Uncharacterized protein n=1 Tax=Canavalia gladiata TaxID=3824 RepID=A0AAN9R5A9_CANGL